MDYNTIINKYSEIDIEMSKYEKEKGLEKGTINVLSKDLKILKEDYENTFGIEADDEVLLFGRRVIEVKLNLNHIL